MNITNCTEKDKFSLYKAGGPLTKNDKSYIYRKAENDLFNFIERNEYVKVIAPRQYGKTSLLFNLQKKLDSFSSWRCAYIDLSIFQGLEIKKWYRSLGHELGRKLTPKNIPEINNQLELRSYLLNDLNEHLEGVECICIILDEVGSVYHLSSNDSDSFFMVLRNIYSIRDDYELKISIILSGAIDPAKIVQNVEISPFNIAQDIDLDDFNEEESLHFFELLKSLKPRIGNEVFNEIYSWTSGQPYLTQVIYSNIEKKLLDNNNLEITKNDINQIIEECLLYKGSLFNKNSNIRHINKSVELLSKNALEFWEKFANGEHIEQNRLTQEVAFELYLTGAVKNEADKVFFRNKIYYEIFKHNNLNKHLYNFDDNILVHIICGTEDSETAQHLYQDLKKVGLKPWLNEKDLLPGQNCIIETKKIMKQSKFIIILISSNSLGNRGQFHKTLNDACKIQENCSENDIFIIPVRLDGCEMPDCIVDLKYSDLFPSYEEGLKKILLSIKKSSK